MTIKWLVFLSDVFACMGAALLINIGMSDLRKAKLVARKLWAMTAFILFTLSLYCIITNLGTPSRAIFLLGHPTAPLSIVAITITAAAIISLVYTFAGEGGFRLSMAVLAVCAGLILAMVLGRYHMTFTRPALKHYLLILMVLAFVISLSLHFNFITKKNGAPARAAFVSALIFSGFFAAFVLRINALGATDKILQISRLLNGDLVCVFRVTIAALALMIGSDIFRLRHGGNFLNFLAFIGCLIAGAGMFYLFNVTQTAVRTMYS